MEHVETYQIKYFDEILKFLLAILIKGININFFGKLQHILQKVC